MDNNQDKIAALVADIPGARLMTALELNDMRFSGRKTVITPALLRQMAKKKAKPHPLPPSKAVD